MIISFLNQKGGVGKTTLAVHTAAGLALDGLDVILVDADPQGSALDWLAARQKPPLFAVVGMPRPVLHRQLPRLAATVDAVVIDGPPSLANIARSAMLASDLVLIPVQPSPYDVWAVGDLVELVDEARLDHDSIDARFVVSRRIANTVIGRDVAEALGEWPVPVLETHITQRVAFAESAATGLAVMESAPGSAAAGEVRSLVREVMALTAGSRRAAA
ncbi:MAG: AAA family ATPase [bacterium]|nr:AAA family ATPase [bacterium]